MLGSLFNPKAVAVIGASSKKLHIGNRIVKNLLKFGYKGIIYPINPKSNEICGIRAYKSILDVPSSVDVAHIVIPAKFVPMAVEDCGRKGIKNVIINSGGFSEIGIEGASIQSNFMKIASKYSIRILGPNCQGIINSDKDVRAYCNFTFTFPEPGNISIVALSGGVAEFIHQGFASTGVGTRIYASSGNACDISISEIIQYLGNDEATKVIVIYVEGLKNSKNFMEALKEVGAKKPILAMKGGRTSQGAKAAASHTGGLAKQGITTELIFKKTKILDFNNEARMIDAAVVLASQPIPKGNRVGIITNTGGPAVIASDVLMELGLILPELSKKTIKLLKLNLHKEASINNPVDILATGTAEHYKQCLKAMILDDRIDSIFIIFVTPFFVDTESIATEIAKASKRQVKPIVCNLMTDLKKWHSTEKILRDAGVPCFKMPSEASHALGALNRYRMILKSKPGGIRLYDGIDYNSVSDILNLAEKNHQYYLSAAQVYTILGAYGINVPRWYVSNDQNGVLKSAAKIGYPVVVKADSLSLIHKSDVSGVALNLQNESDVKKAINTMEQKIKDKDLKFLIQKYIPNGLELIFGAKSESNIGHILMFGLGGIFVEVFKDIVFNLSPITDVEAKNMIRSIKSYDIIRGIRGRKGVKLELLIEILQRLSQLVTDFRQIKELDFNPVAAFEKEVFILDARILLKR